MVKIPDLPELPDELLRYLINFPRNELVKDYCGHCRDVTDQIVVSFSQLPDLRKDELRRFTGRILDWVPFAGTLLGRPVFCTGCKKVRTY